MLWYPRSYQYLPGGSWFLPHLLPVPLPCHKPRWIPHQSGCPHPQFSGSVPPTSVPAGQVFLSASSGYSLVFPDTTDRHKKVPVQNASHVFLQSQTAVPGRSHQRSVSDYCVFLLAYPDGEAVSLTPPKPFPAGDTVLHTGFSHQTHGAPEYVEFPHPCAAPSPECEHESQTVFQTPGKIP